MMRAEEVLEAQRDLIQRLDDKRFRWYVGDVSMSEHLQSDLSDEEAKNYVRDQIGHGLQRVVQTAYAFQVTADMTPLVVQAAMSLDQTDRFEKEMMPTGCGIVRFEQPLPMTDVRGRKLLIHWIVWGPPTNSWGDSTIFNGGPAATIWWFNDHTVQPDEIGQQIIEDSVRDPKGFATKQMIGRWGIAGMSIVSQDVRVGPATVLPSTETMGRIIVSGDIPHEGTNLVRYIMALWLLLQQTIVTQTEYQAPRAHRRWARRMNIPTGVTVIDLRRTGNYHRQEGETQVEWSHRWVVRGHWRWQACGEGRKERKRIWIHDFVKGPDDMPLVITDKLYRLRR